MFKASFTGTTQAFHRKNDSFLLVGKIMRYGKIRDFLQMTLDYEDIQDGTPSVFLGDLESPLAIVIFPINKGLVNLLSNHI